jgi:AcrR family transcriptional regulator
MNPKDKPGSGCGTPTLPPGRHSLSRSYVACHQRERLSRAVAEEAHEHGIAQLTVVGITARAHVSRKTFYELFEDKDACLEFACQESRDLLFQPVKAACAERWIDRVREAVAGLLDAAAEDPVMAELYLFRSASTGGGIGRTYESGIAMLSELLAQRDGRGDGERGEIEDLIARGVISVIGVRLRRGGAEELGAMHDELVRMMSISLVGIDETMRT